MNTVFIYALNEPCPGPDPTAGRTRYIGKAADPYARYERHLRRNHEEDCYKARWIRSLLVVGKAPILEILDEVPEREWGFWEKEWIRLYRALGFRLTNTLDGGGGGPAATLETRAKISDKVSGERNPNFGKHHSPETRAKISAANMGRRDSEETCLKKRLSHLGKTSSTETREKQSTSLKGRKLTPEHCAAMSAARTGMLLGEKNPNFGKSPSEETRAKIRAGLLGKSQSPESNLKRSASLRRHHAEKREKL